MKKTALVLFTCLLSAGFGFSQDTLKAQYPQSTDTPASFPGGRAAMNAYIQKNFHYPETALEQGISGQTFVRMTVNEDGTLSDITVVRELKGCPECDEQAVCLVREMPDWIPATRNGKPITTFYTLPVIFNLY